MSTPNPADRTPGSPRTRREHRLLRAAAERRRSTAQKEFNQLQRHFRGDLRNVRRQGETAAVVARSKAAEIGVRGIARLLESLRPGRETR